jgi:hypothetical protein
MAQGHNGFQLRTDVPLAATKSPMLHCKKRPRLWNKHYIEPQSPRDSHKLKAEAQYD